MTSLYCGVIQQIHQSVKAYAKEVSVDRFFQQLQKDAHATQKLLTEKLSSASIAGEIYRPKRLLQSMRHGTLNGGKRLRPFLILQSGAMFGAQRAGLLQIAAALECVHCYSLVHDDLPAMDDDELRRGHPTVHKAYDEATAILAGDALLTFAFDIISDEATHRDAIIRIELVSKLAKAAGMGGMAGGQMLDLQPESDNITLQEIARMQAMKTGALIKYSCEAGGICAGATVEELAALSAYGEAIGQAFQLADDILDVTATQHQLGKGIAKDDRQGKQTQLSTMGIEGARQMANDLMTRAQNALSIFGPRAELLNKAAHFAVHRSQ